jgi:hypothetical protein
VGIRASKGWFLARGHGFLGCFGILNNWGFLVFLMDFLGASKLALSGLRPGRAAPCLRTLDFVERSYAQTVRIPKISKKPKTQDVQKIPANAQESMPASQEPAF